MEIEQANNTSQILQTLQQLCYQNQGDQQINNNPNELSQITEEFLKSVIAENRQILNQQIQHQQQQLQQQQQQLFASLGLFNPQNIYNQTCSGIQINNPNPNSLISSLNNANESVQNLPNIFQAQLNLANQSFNNPLSQFQQLSDSMNLINNEEQQNRQITFAKQEAIQQDQQNHKLEHNTDEANENDYSRSNDGSKNKENLNQLSQPNTNLNNSLCKNEEELIKKDFSYETILKQVYNPLALQALHGDIFIDLNYDYANSQLFAQPSLINQYKHVISVENFEERGLMEINIQSNYTPVYQFQSLTQALVNHPELSLQELGERLHNYQSIAQKMLEKGNLCKTMTGFSKMQEMMGEAYKKFEIQARDYLTELKKTNKLFIYSLRQLNLENFGYEIKKYGYSSDFLQLLGYNMHQFKNLAVRKGLIELQNFKGRIALNKMTLDLLLGQIKDSIRLKTSYITSDNLELQVDGIVKQIYNTDSNIQSNGMFTHSEFLAIVVLDVNNDTMKQIYSIRQANKQMQNNQTKINNHSSSSNSNSSATTALTTLSNQPTALAHPQQTNQASVFGGPAFPPLLPNCEEIDVDEYYSMETQILIEKFYEDKASAKRKVHRIKRNQLQEQRKEVIELITSNQHVLSSKTCGYRFIKTD